VKRDQAFKYLSYPSPVFCVGTYNEDGRPNLMTIVLGGMCNHNPPLFLSRAIIFPTPQGHEDSPPLLMTAV